MIDHLQHARHDLIAAGIVGWADEAQMGDNNGKGPKV